MRVRSIVALAAVAYAVFLLVLLPASVIAPRVAAASHGALTLGEARGSAWNGSARAIVATTGGRVELDEVRWRFLPARLAAGRIAFAVAMAAPGIRADLDLERGASDWAARNLSARADASKASAALPWISPWHPEGALTLAASELVWNDREIRGELTAQWSDAAAALSQVRPLGSYRVEAKGEGGALRLNVSTTRGPLLVSGRGSFAPPAHVAFSGEARAEGENARALDPLLDLMGPRRADGARSLELRID